MKPLTSAALFLVVPALLVFTRLTRGEYLPFIATAKPQQWNVQYLPLAVISLIAAGLALLAWRRWRPAKATLLAAIWNAACAGVFLFAVVTMWGEKV
jgi:hypothetical protein